MSTSDEGATRGVTEQMRDTARQVKDDVRALGTQMRDVANEKMHGLKDQAAEYYRQGKIRARAIEEDMVDYIREKPMTSLLVAAGVGVLLGIFLRRR
jgi:ElaB/YqjD/DUF883 family membrane-anchored ribosome-binding protein